MLCETRFAVAQAKRVLLGNSEVAGFGLVFTADGSRAYFVRPDSARTTAIYTTTKVGKEWTAPSICVFHSSLYQETIPFFSPDGKKVFWFSNERDSATFSKRNLDLWEADFRDGKLSSPHRMKNGINTDSVEYYGSMSKKGDLYFSSWRSGGFGNADIYVSTWKQGKFTLPKNLGATVNNGFLNSSPAIAPNEEFVIYYSQFQEKGSEGLYISFNTKGRWSRGLKLPASVNTGDFIIAPRISPDGATFYFTKREVVSSETKVEEYRMYAIPIAELHLEELRAKAEF
jgi:Tol biopolymer transport system component